MNWTPRPYQVDAVKFVLRTPRAGLFLDMGLGKTSVTLAALRTMIFGKHIKKVLLIAPIRTLYTTWPEEILKWDNFSQLTYTNLHGQSDPIALLPQTHIYGINPESALRRMRSGELFSSGFDMLVVDESSAFKNPSSQRFALLRKHLHTFPRRLILTGTPAPNGLEDLWSQMYIVDRGEALGQYVTHFRNRFCTPNYNGYGYTVNEGARRLIYEAIAPKVMRLDAASHIDMPELVINKIPVKLPPEAMKTYKAMLREFIIVLEEHTIASPNAAVAGGRCRQIANGGIYTADGTTQHIHSAKVEALKEIVENLQGNPLLVFYEFKHDVQRIKEALGDIPNLTESRQPDQLIAAFNRGEIPVMIGHPTTIGLGLNLQARCHHVAWMGVPWDLGLLSQANARVWRQGQEADRVFIHYIMAEDTLDEHVYQAIERKADIQNELFREITRIASETSLP